MAFLNETGLKTFLTNCDKRYLKLTGGSTTGRILNNQGGAWIAGRDNCVIYKSRRDNDSWFPIVGAGTANGVWCLGPAPGGGDQFIFSYTSETDYQAGTNKGNQWYLSKDGKFGIVAGNVYGTVAVTNGGTGATTWTSARENLGTYARTTNPSNQGASWAGTIWVQY